MIGAELNREQLEILQHTHRNGRFCGDSPDMRVLVSMGLMHSLGLAAWCPDEFFQITGAGREAIKATIDPVQ